MCDCRDPGRLVGQEDSRLIDQRSRDRCALYTTWMEPSTLGETRLMSGTWWAMACASPTGTRV